MNQKIFTPRHESRSIVLVGEFNPAIFHPYWFVHKKLCTDDGVQTDDNTISSSDVSSVKLDGYHIQVTKKRFSISTDDIINPEKMIDFVARTFKILKETPIKAMGINSDGHFDVPSQEIWHQVGDLFAPKEIWKKFLPEPGLEILKISSPRPNDDCSGYRHIEGQPSAKMPKDKYGVFVRVNDHFEISSTQDDIYEDSAEKAIKVLENNFKESWSVCEEFLSLTAKEIQL